MARITIDQMKALLFKAHHELRTTNKYLSRTQDQLADALAQLGVNTTEHQYQPPVDYVHVKPIKPPVQTEATDAGNQIIMQPANAAHSSQADIANRFANMSS